MDVTPSNKMFAAMQAFVDATIGEEPSKLLVGPGASAIRDRRRVAFQFLHSFAAICMREGVNRKVMEVKGERGGRVYDAADLRAIQQATRDAEEGKNLIGTIGEKKPH